MNRYPVRAGIFSSTADALRLVEKLQNAGFTWSEISVVCSDEKKEALFPAGVQKMESTEHGNAALDAAGIGAVGLGGMALAAAMLSTAGTAIMVIGAFAGVAAAGTFATLLATRGFESEATDYYEQSVLEGEILIAVEVSGDDANAETRLAQAARLIEECGARPIPLAH